jgi:hypothetical protein
MYPEAEAAAHNNSQPENMQPKKRFMDAVIAEPLGHFNGKRMTQVFHDSCRNQGQLQIWENNCMKTTHHIRPVVAVGGVIACLFLMRPAHSAFAFKLHDVISVGAAYTTHLMLHEMGHQVVAQDVGATGSKMRFLSNQSGEFYLGVSTYDSIPSEAKLPYALGGERMSGFAFDYALKLYRQQPSTYNKALLLFSGADFLAYTVLSNYVEPDAEMHDPNIVREETGCSKELLLGLVLGKTLLNAYRVANPEVHFAPEVWVDDRSAALLLRFPF